jgi:hypothetical protein
LQRETASERFSQHADRQSPDPHPYRHDTDRQCRQRRIGRQHRTNDTASRHDDGGIAAGQRLCGGEHHCVTGRKAVVGDFDCGVGQRDHGRVPSEAFLLAFEAERFQGCVFTTPSLAAWSLSNGGDVSVASNRAGRTTATI